MLGNGSLRVAQGDVIKNIELFTGNPVCDIPSHMSFWYFTLATWCFIIRAEHIQFCCPASFPQMGTGLWSPDGVMERLVLWVSQVWQQLNACLSRLGTHEALLGPQLFLSCPVVPNNAQVIVRCVNMSLSRKRLYFVSSAHLWSEGVMRFELKLKPCTVDCLTCTEAQSPSWWE